MAACAGMAVGVARAPREMRSVVGESEVSWMRNNRGRCGVYSAAGGVHQVLLGMGQSLPMMETGVYNMPRVGRRLASLHTASLCVLQRELLYGSAHGPVHSIRQRKPAGFRAQTQTQTLSRDE